jgi:dolichol kinase
MKEEARKLVHLCFGAAIAGAVFVFPREQAILLLAGSLLPGLILAELVKTGHRVPLISFLVARLEREGEFPGKGAIYFVVSSLFCVAFFPSAMAAAGVLSLAVLDSVSALAGLRFGKTRVNGRKTLEGFLAGVAANSLVLCAFLDPVRATLVSLVAGAVELAVPLDDNLLIPPAACLCLSLVGI